VEGDPISWPHSGIGRIIGILAFSKLSDSPVPDGTGHVEVECGQVMYYDGDKPVKWQGKGGYGFMVYCWKM
jgi:hypothetical protein